MALNDNEFKLTSTGVVLNADSASFPFIDIEHVSGLDSPPFRESLRDHEGMDGGFIDAEFEKGRDIIIEGVAYCDNGNIETYLDSLKANYAPVPAPVEFYYKAPGVAERLLFVKPRGARFDWETARRIGLTNVQLMMYAEDPRIYDNSLQSVSIPFGGSATTGFGFANVLDTFTRSVTAGFGTMDSGETYTLTGTAANFNVDGSRGSILSTLTSQTALVTGSSYADFDARVKVRSPAATGDNINMYIMTRATAADNGYLFRAGFDDDGTLDIFIQKIVTGSTTTLVSQANVTTYTALQEYTIHANGSGSELRLSVYAGDTEPAAYQLTVTDSSFTAAGQIGLRTLLSAANTNVNPTPDFDNFQMVKGFGFNLSFGATVPVSGGTVAVGGNRPTPAILTLSGTMVNPIIFNVTDSKTLTFTDLSLGVSDSLVIDLLNRTIVLNGTTNKRANLVTPDWFLFNPGSTFMVLGGGSGSGTLLIEYRNAWR